MIKRLTYLAVLAVTLLAGFSSCSSDEDATGGVVVDNGAPANLKISISQPRTYATADNNATDAETLFKTVDVYIYNASNVLVKHVQLDGASDFSYAAGANDTYTGTSKIATTTGVKNVYVGVNLPAALAAAIEVNGPLAAASITNPDELTSATNGFAMFSAEVKTTTLAADDTDPANTITVQVKRLVAKVTVQAKSTLSYNVAGGLISDLQFAVRNVNKTFFPLPLVDAGVVKDPNWENQAAGVIAASFYQPAAGDYIAINASSITDNKLLAAKYGVENTSKGLFDDELTYASIRAKFVPATVKVYTNGTDATGGFSDLDNSASAPATFYRLRLLNGTSVYTTDLDVAQDYANFLSLNPASVETYANGYCYYSAYVNKDNGYNVFRNDFYKTTITKINGLGSTTPDETEHIPLETPTNISVEVEVINWNMVDEETELIGK